jgi:hypothetical protein
MLSNTKKCQMIFGNKKTEVNVIRKKNKAFILNAAKMNLSPSALTVPQSSA